MTLIIMVRHGQSITNKAGILSDSDYKYPLTEEGVMQAEVTAKELAKKIKVAKLYTSPVLRARQTAEILSKALKKEVIVDKRLKERGWGLMEGKEARMGAWRFHMSKKEAASVESWEAIKKRVYSFADDVSKLDGVIVAVSHVDQIAAMAVRAFDIKDGELSVYGLVSPNAGINVFGFDGTYKVIATGLPLLPDSIMKMSRPYMKRISGRP